MRKKPIDINPDFQRAWIVMENSSRHVFITGRAGTGKSTLLDYFRNSTRKEVAVLAPTGVAALNVQGQTIHSFFGFKPSVTPERVKKVSGWQENIYRELDMIIIDEVSMVRADLLDCVEKFLRLNGPRRKEWFGGVQMVFIGDLYQLPPVVAGSEKEIFTHRYETPYFFSAQVFGNRRLIWSSSNWRKCTVRPIRIHCPPELNPEKVCTDEDMEKLNRGYVPDFVPPDDAFYVTLTSTNDLAAARNLEKLESLPGSPVEYDRAVTGVFDNSTLPAEEILRLKPGHRSCS